MMSKELLLLLLLFTLGYPSCNQSSLPSFLSFFYSSDHAVVYRLDDSGNTNIQKIEQLNKNELQILGNMFEPVPGKNEQCDHEGMIVLYNHKKPLLNVRFNTDESCSNGSFLMDDEVHTVQLTKSGQQYLKGLIASR